MMLWRIAPVLNLAGRALVALAEGNYAPPPVRPPDGFAMFNTPFDDMTVNAFLVWDPKTRAAVAFDTGADCTEMLATIKAQNLEVRLILLTHAHRDHVADLGRLRDATGAPVHISSREMVPGAEGIEEGREFEVGPLRIQSLLTWGHSRGGMTYFIRGLGKQPLAVVGDAVFAGSMGGGAVSYRDALETNLEKIMTLPGETIICPGHGPLTTVAHEKANNPFFAAQKEKEE